MTAPGLAFRAERRAVAKRMAAGLIAAAVGLGLAALFGRAAPPADRLEAAAWGATAALAWLAAAIGDVARRRLGSERDIVGEGAGAVADASPALARARAVLQNTLEQAALAVPLYLLLALAEPRAVAAILVMAACFSAGRALFWMGYSRGASGRALGFTLTFYPSLGGLLWLAAALASRAF